MNRVPFQIEARASGSKARAGRLTTLHGTVETPTFMPVGTHATVRTQRVDDLKTTGAKILLANTYHLLLRPGPEVFKRFGGIHKFMKWDGAVLTDSGGFQIFCMPNHRNMTEEGAEFLSYVDGKKILLTPELSIATQKAIGSDIMMVLDQCVPSTVEFQEAERAMELTHRWALRSLAARGDSMQGLYAIVQGACYPELRKRSAEFLTQHPFDGFAVGGLAVGEGRKEREDTTDLTSELLPEDKPRYLMGVGTPIDLLEAVHRGMDQFDCILPTAMAQQGVAFTSEGKISLRRGIYKFADAPLDPNCSCSTCAHYSRAYLHHLVKVKEHLGWHLIAFHNISFYQGLMRGMRAAILDDTFLEFYKTWKPRLEATDGEGETLKPARKEKPVSTKLGDYEIKVNEAGFASVLQVSSGEVMHSVVRPEEEARRLYLEQSQILERIREQDLVIWDVGMGAGTNAMVTIRAVEELAQRQPRIGRLHIESFENDLDSLRLALLHPEKFPYIRHSASFGVLHRGKWASKKFPIDWQLHSGDFRATFAGARKPDIVFFDPFSWKTNGPLWELGFWQKLVEFWGEGDVEVFTYSSSTAVRSTFLAAGLFVAEGVGTGPKGSTTIGLTQKAAARARHKLLDRSWLERWERSDAKNPLGMSGVMAAESIRQHPQFASNLTIPSAPVLV